MSSRKSPLRDRLLSNSPDPIKSSIIRDSGMGWISPSANTGGTSSGSGSITSPLRIAKRESSPRIQPQLPLARRSSSSFKHVTTNNLVSKSPFKSRIPTASSSPAPVISWPVSRKVSGEKRPRPSSLHEQTEVENERPFALKRERRQSKTYQGLIQKEPVTKSPFRQRTPSAEEPPGPPPPPLVHLISRTTPPSSPSSPPSPTPINASLVPTASQARFSSVSPGRPSLVSRRMHGPRLNNSSSSKRERRKTVTFDERCDVVEFDRDEDSLDDAFNTGSGEGSDVLQIEQETKLQEVDEFSSGEYLDLEEPMEKSSQGMVVELFHSSHASDNNRSFLGITLGSEPNMSGLVDEIFSSSPATTIDEPAHSSTPPHDSKLPNCSANAQSSSAHIDLPIDLEMEDRIPLGRSHAIRVQRQMSQSSQFSPLQHSSPVGHIPEQRRSSFQKLDSQSGSPCSSPACPCPLNTPENLKGSEDYNRSSPVLVFHQPVLSENILFSTPPLKQLTHSEVLRKDGLSADDILMLPGAPSPTNTSKRFFDIGEFNSSASPPSLAIGQQSHGPLGEDLSDPFSIPTTADHTVGSSHTKFSFLGAPDALDEDSQPTEDESAGMEEGSNIIIKRDHGLIPSPGNSPLDSHARTDADSLLENESSICGRFSPLGASKYSSPLPTNASPVSRGDHFQGSMDIVKQDYEDQRDDRDRLSVITAATDFSIETAIVGQAERAVFTRPDVEGSLSPSRDGLGDIPLTADGSSSRRPWEIDTMETDIKTFDSTGTGHKTSDLHASLKIRDVDVDMDMRSALDRLMDDVAGTHVDGSLLSEEDHSHDPLHQSSFVEPENNDSALLHQSFASHEASLSSVMSTPPPPPPKDNIRSREQMILEKRREARHAEGDDDEFGEVSRPSGKSRRGQELLGVGRPSRRRSMSTGDADRRPSRTRGTDLEISGVGELEGLDDHFGDSIERELRRAMQENSSKQGKRKYLVRERQGTIYASSSDPDGVSRMAGLGDVAIGKAWRAVRRPSDLNEYSKQIKEYRAQENSSKAYGKVFVKVLSVKGIHVPLPQEPTSLTCTLNNGIHFVSTPESRMAKDFNIEQEFELIEHNRLEFTLTLKVRRDPHIIAQFKTLPTFPPLPAPVPAPPPVVQTTSKGGMRSFFSSPKKASKDKPPPRPPAPTQPSQSMAENLARYLKADGTFARAFISFKDVAHRCDARLFETSYPLIGQRMELGEKYSTLQVGEIVLQMFRLPPLPGVAPEDLPQSLEECHRGLRHINWHKVTYFEGTLTQSGGDCITWRRRQLRLIGSNLVAFNDVTKKATAAIDLKKAIAVQDDQEVRKNAGSSLISSFRRCDDDLYCVERSFRLIFPHNQEIIFFADTDEEKARWVDILRALVGHIPPHPLWAELLWQRQEDLAKGLPVPEVKTQIPVVASSPVVPQPPQSRPLQQPQAPRPLVQTGPSWLLPKTRQR